MKIFLTGGAVRDELLGRKVRDRDYIILDADKEHLIKMNYEPVGVGFEVFLHPKTKDEYTLAVGNNLELELKRRDLTINSIAQNIESKEYSDPFNGLEDIKAKVLRHTSESFADDPIRLLRLARFKTQLPEFVIHKDTQQLIKNLSMEENLFSSIAGERFLLELTKALSLSSPRQFFESLREWGILDLFFKELSDLFSISKKDSWNQVMQTLEKACSISPKFSVRFAALTNELDQDFTKRFKVDSYTVKLAQSVYRNKSKIYQASSLQADEILKLLIGLNALREGTQFEDVLLCCGAIQNYDQSFLTLIRDEILKISYENLIEKFSGKKLGIMIEQSRIKKINEIISKK